MQPCPFLLEISGFLEQVTLFHIQAPNLFCTLPALYGGDLFKGQEEINNFYCGNNYINGSYYK